MVSARARGFRRLARRRIHVIVHRHHHRNEYDRVVEQMQLDSWNPDLADTRRDFAAEPEVMRLRLIEQNEMLEVVPELNPESDHPPRMRPPGKSFPQNPETNHHYQRKAVMEHFRFHEPWIVHAEYSHRHRAWPVQPE